MTTSGPISPDGVPDQLALILARVRREEVRRRWIIVGCWIGLSIAAISFWHFASGRLVDPFWVSSPSRVWERLVIWVTTGELWPHLTITILEAVTGFVLGSVLSLIFGLALGMLPLAYQILSPFLNAMFALPKITLGPLLILYFGIGFEMKFALSTIITFFLVFFSTVEAVRRVDPDLIAVVRIAGASTSQLIRTTLFPAALGGILSGMRLAVPYALQGAVFGEILASNIGLGYLLQRSAGTFDITGVFASLVIITLLATLVNESIFRIELWSQRWKVA
jgi:NitT/TauT family transport system permease protein